MKVFLDTLLWLLTACSAALAMYWAVVAFHIARTVRTIPTLRDALRLPPAPACAEGRAPLPVCIIVPAHNEEACIGDLARSLLAQDYPSLRIAFVLDRCTDRTAQVVRDITSHDHRFEILQVSQCPPGWTGKVHAMWRGVQDSAGAASVGTGGALLFVDADTVLDPAAARAAVALLQSRGLDMVSLLSTLTADRWFEKLVQPAAGMELLRQYPIIRANDPLKRRAFANGQFILVRRAAYDAAGGHEAIRAEVLEDVWLARKVTALGHGAGLFLADGMLRCRMYTSWPDFQRGWLRIYGECANRKPARLRKSARRIVLTGAILPLAGLVSVTLGAATLAGNGGWEAVSATALGAAGLLIWGGALAAIYRMGRVPMWTVLGYVAGVFLVSRLLRKAARNLETGEPTVWAGMAYQRQTR
jgi:hypothetical protein